jgi:hypothetical protein
MPVPLAGAHHDAPLQEILNQWGNLFPGNVLGCNNDPFIYHLLRDQGPFSRSLQNDSKVRVRSPGFMEYQALWIVKLCKCCTKRNTRSDSALGAAKIQQKPRLVDRTARQKSEPDAPVALPVQSFEPPSGAEAYSGWPKSRSR